MNWTQPICQNCWIARNPDRDPVRVKDGEAENCCDCGEATNDGIYIRANPLSVKFPKADDN